MDQSVEDLRARAAKLIAAAKALEERSSRRFDSAPGAYITGGSGRRRSGLHRKTARAIDGSLEDLRKARKLRERASVLTDRAGRLSPEFAAQRAARREAEAEADRQERAARRAAPILNRSTGHPMTSAEWSAKHRDFKSLMQVEVDGVTCRVRMTMLPGPVLGEVFITDRKVRERPR